MPAATSKKPQESKSAVSDKKDAAPSRSVSGDRKDGTENEMEKVATLIDKKIRNLEKRKQRLEDIRDQQAKGKTVTTEQKAAVAKMDEVDLLLENFRELQKSLKPVMDSWEKTQKREEKVREKERMTQETGRLKELLRIQEVQKALRDPEIRTHFENGTNGASKLEEEELNLLDQCFALISPIRGEEWDQKCKTGAQHNYNLLTGSSKPFINGKPYKEVKELLNKILGSGYFENQAQLRSSTPISEAKSGSASPVTSEEPQMITQVHQPEAERVQEPSHSPPAMAQIPQMVFENSALSMMNGKGAPVMLPGQPHPPHPHHPQQPQIGDNSAFQDPRVPVMPVPVVPVPVAPAVNFCNTGIEPQMPGTHGSNFTFIQEDQSGAVGSPPQMGLSSSLNHHMPYQSGQAGASEIPNMGYTNSVYSSNVPHSEPSYQGYQGVQQIFPVQQPRDPPPPIPMPDGGPNTNQRKDLDPGAAPFVSGSRSLFTTGDPADAGTNRQNTQNQSERTPEPKNYSARNSTSEVKEMKNEAATQGDTRSGRNGEGGPDRKEVSRNDDSKDQSEKQEYRSERRGRGTGGIYRGGYRNFRGQDNGGYRGGPRGGRGNGWSRGGTGGWNRGGNRGGNASNNQHHQQQQQHANNNRGTATAQ